MAVSILQYADRVVQSPVVNCDSIPRFPVLCLNDREDRKSNVDFHVQVGDYFATLATIVGLLADDNEVVHSRQKKLSQDLKKDLMYMQDMYRIVRK